MNWRHGACYVIMLIAFRIAKMMMMFCPHFAIFDLCTTRKGDEKVCYWEVWPVYHHWSQLLPKFCITRNIRSPSRGARSRFFYLFWRQGAGFVFTYVIHISYINSIYIWAGFVGWLRGWKPLVQMDLELVRQQIFRLCQEGQTVSFSFIHPFSDAIASIEAFPFDDITTI